MKGAWSLKLEFPLLTNNAEEEIKVLPSTISSVEFPSCTGNTNIAEADVPPNVSEEQVPITPPGRPEENCEEDNVNMEDTDGAIGI